MYNSNDFIFCFLWKNFYYARRFFFLEFLKKFHGPPDARDGGTGSGWTDPTVRSTKDDRRYNTTDDRDGCLFGWDKQIFDQTGQSAIIETGATTKETGNYRSGWGATTTNDRNNHGVKIYNSYSLN
jgi:hypothetical protein